MFADGLIRKEIANQLGTTSHLFDTHDKAGTKFNLSNDIYIFVEVSTNKGHYLHVTKP